MKKLSIFFLEHICRYDLKHSLLYNINSFHVKGFSVSALVAMLEYNMYVYTQDGRKWKARMSTANTRVRNELPVIPEQSRGSESGEIKSVSTSKENKRISPSLSAPEDVLLTLL